MIVRFLTRKGTNSFIDQDLDGLKLLDKLLDWFTQLNTSYATFYDLHSLEKIHEDWRVPSNFNSGTHKYLRNYDIWKIVLKLKWTQLSITDEEGNDESDTEITEKRGIGIDIVSKTNMVGLNPFILKEPTSLELSNKSLMAITRNGGLVKNFNLTDDTITINLFNKYVND